MNFEALLVIFPGTNAISLALRNPAKLFEDSRESLLPIDVARILIG